MIEASATYDYFSTEEQLHLVSQIGSSRVKKAEFIERVLARGLTTAEELAAMNEAWLAWPTRPDAFLANSHGDVVGRKGHVVVSSRARDYATKRPRNDLQE